MPSAREKIVIVEANSISRENLHAALHSAGYEVIDFGATQEALDAIHESAPDVLLLDASLREPNARELVANIRDAAATDSIRLLLLVDAGPEERVAALDLGADDAISRPWDAPELLARVRAQLRVRRAELQLREKMRIADEGQQIAHTAFEALAVTEKMTGDAFALDRRLKIGFAAVFAMAVLMAAIYLLFARSAQKENQRANAIIARLEGGLTHQQDLIAEARKYRDQQPGSGGTPADKDELKKKADELKAKMAGADSSEVATLQKQLEETNNRLKRIEQEGAGARNLIPADVESVCLLHVAVAFRQQQIG